MNTARRTIIASALAGVASMTLTPVRAMANTWLRSAVPGNQILMSGAVIRFSDPDGWPSIHANGAHVGAGVESVRVNPDNGRLQVFQTIKDPARHPIIFAFAQSDETLGGRGITVGASGGTADTEYVFFDSKLGRPLDLRNYSDRMRMQGKNSNVWLGWCHMA